MAYDDSDEIESRSKCYKCTCCCGGAVLFITFLLLGISFSKIEYYEMGLPQRRTTGVVDKTIAYPAGNHYMGPDYEFVKFPADVQNIELDDLSAWTKASASDAGTSVDIDVSFQYRLILDRLPQLYEKRQKAFEPFVQNIATQAIKNTATNYSADDFLIRREEIEKGFFTALTADLLEAEATALNVQLRRVDFPATYVQRKLDTAVQELKNDAEAYKRSAAKVREETVFKVKEITNEADLTEKTAEAEAKLLKANAEADAIKMRQSARTSGLFSLRKRLGLTQQKHFVSLDYLITLADSNGFKSYIDFATVLAGNKN